MNDSMGWVVNISLRMPEGPFYITEQTKNGWVKFDDRKAARKCEVYFTEHEALNEVLKNLERRKMWIVRDIARIETRIE